MDNLKIYNAYADVPKEAQKPIKAGRLKGMTDINPMWRIKALTEEFGPVGFGWYYKIVDKRIEITTEGNAAFVDIELFVKVDGEWSMPIAGSGGSQLLQKESKGFHLNDECFKMALTDAISVACKALGFGANIYWQATTSKYDKGPSKDAKSMSVQELAAETMTFGKHKGTTFGELLKTDSSYVQWLCESEKTDQFVKDAFGKLYQAIVEQKAHGKQ